jgi:hypothetical protein
MKTCKAGIQPLPSGSENHCRLVFLAVPTRRSEKCGTPDVGIQNRDKIRSCGGSFLALEQGEGIKEQRKWSDAVEGAGARQGPSRLPESRPEEGTAGRGGKAQRGARRTHRGRRVGAMLPPSSSSSPASKGLHLSLSLSAMSILLTSLIRHDAYLD